MSILKQVTFDNYRRKKDKTFSFTFTTDLEQNKEDVNVIFDCVDNGGVLLFKPNGLLTDEEIKAIEQAKIPKEGKSKSQRLRNVMFVYFESELKHKTLSKDFNEFYANEMEKIIEHYKSKLDNEV